MSRWERVPNAGGRKVRTDPDYVDQVEVALKQMKSRLAHHLRLDEMPPEAREAVDDVDSLIRRLAEAAWPAGEGETQEAGRPARGRFDQPSPGTTPMEREAASLLKALVGRLQKTVEDVEGWWFAEPRDDETRPPKPPTCVNDCRDTQSRRIRQRRGWRVCPVCETPFKEDQ